jgi:hypothetical protein
MTLRGLETSLGTKSDGKVDRLVRIDITSDKASRLGS